jgi:hypothetical protein
VSGRALWMPDAFRDAGVRFGRVSGWETRGHEGLDAWCVVCHHIGIGGDEESPGLNVVTFGRPGLRNCLCNIHLSRSGFPTIVASGVAWHAGAGGFRGLRGNPKALGIEAEGTTGQPMSRAQREGYEITVAILLEGIRKDQGWACSHNEWRAEKPDPWGLIHAPGGMVAFRADVARLLATKPYEEDELTPDERRILTETYNAVQALVQTEDDEEKLIVEQILPRLDKIEQRLGRIERRPAAPRR